MSLMIDNALSTLRGKAGARAVIYARVSSIRQSTEGDGLNSQITRCAEYAKYKGYAVVETFKDDLSGSLTKRPGMEAMLLYLRAHRQDPHVVIIDDISRLARGIEAHLQLRSQISGAGGILESPSIEFGEDSDSQLVEHLLAAVSQHQRQKNGEQTKNRMRARIMNGYWVFHAPLGYQYQRIAGHNMLLIRHEPMAAIIQEALEGFASGRFETQSEVLRFFESLPHFPRDSRGIIRFQRVTDILKNPLYAGMVAAPRWDVSMRKGHHAGLIDYATFEKIQMRLRKKPKVPIRKNVAAEFPLRGFVTCADCQASLTSCWAKGRSRKYAYYHCFTRGCPSHGKSIKREKLEGEFEDLLGALAPSREMFAICAFMFKGLWDRQANALGQSAKAMKRELESIEGQITGLLDRIIEASSPTVIGAYEKRIQKLESGKAALEEKIAMQGKPRTSFEVLLRTALVFLANPLKLWRSENLRDKKTVLKLTFAKRLAYARDEGFRTALPSLPFEIIQRLKGDATGNFNPESELAERESAICHVERKQPIEYKEKNFLLGSGMCSKMCSKKTDQLFKGMIAMDRLPSTDLP